MYWPCKVQFFLPCFGGKFGLPRDNCHFWPWSLLIEASQPNIFWLSLIQKVGSETWGSDSVSDHSKGSLAPVEEMGAWQGRDFKTCTHALPQTVFRVLYSSLLHYGLRPSHNGWYIKSPEFSAEHVSLDSPRLNLKPRPHIEGHKSHGSATAAYMGRMDHNQPL
jgi:hypothetical protein